MRQERATEAEAEGRVLEAVLEFPAIRFQGDPSCTFKNVFSDGSIFPESHPLNGELLGEKRRV